MSKDQCPNINSCRMVSTDIVVPDKDAKQKYMDNWCVLDETAWSKCARYQTKKELGFCPDFVVPDTTLSLDEILDKFEEDNQT